MFAPLIENNMKGAINCYDLISCRFTRQPAGRIAEAAAASDSGWVKN
jgi:hypothetical protein